MKKYHFTYITINIINNKKYIGDHSTDNIDDGYLGSGLYLKKAIKNTAKKILKKKLFHFTKPKKTLLMNKKN